MKTKTTQKRYLSFIGHSLILISKFLGLQIWHKFYCCLKWEQFNLGLKGSQSKPKLHFADLQVQWGAATLGRWELESEWTSWHRGCHVKLMFIHARVPPSNADHVNAMFYRLVGWRKVGDGLGWLKLISPPSAADEEPEYMQFWTVVLTNNLLKENMLGMGDGLGWLKLICLPSAADLASGINIRAI